MKVRYCFVSIYIVNFNTYQAYGIVLDVAFSLIMVRQKYAPIFCNFEGFLEETAPTHRFCRRG